MVAEGRAPPARVLAVDDEPDVLHSLCEVLRTLGGVEVERATSMGTALVMLRERRYDVVLSDERLADGSGLDLLRWAGHLDPSTARVLVSAFDDAATLTRAVNEARIHLFVRKPWDPEEVRRGVHRLLLEQAVLHERMRAFARATVPDPAPQPEPLSTGPWPPS